MNPVNYSYIPVSIAIFLQLIFPYWRNLYCINTWITPPFYVCLAIFLGVYAIFGVLLWKSYEIDNMEIFGLTWGLIAINLIWLYTYKSHKKYSLLLLFVSLLLGYFTYNAIFLSDLTKTEVANSNTLYLNLFSIYIVWIGLMITILIESSDPLEFKKRKMISKK